MSVGTSAAIALGVAAGTAGGAAIAAHKQAGAAREAAKETSQSSNYAADLQSKASAEALAYEKEKDLQAQAQFEATQRANYAQYVARETRMNDVRQQLGMPSRQIAPYVSTTMPGGATGGSTGAGTTTPTSGGSSATGSGGGLPTIDPSKGDLASQISNYFKGRGVSDQETSYWVGKWPELVARGQEIGDPQYAAKRLSQADVFGGGGGSAATGGLPSTIGAYLPSAMAASAASQAMTAPQALPQARYLDPTGRLYQPNTIGRFTV